MDLSPFDLIVVGSGFYGLTIAERAAADLGLKVCVLERRGHVGGNSHSEPDPTTGIEVHRYGSHLFHTGSEEVWDYVRRFAEFTGYRHRVMASHRGRIYPMPVNLGTLCGFFGRHLTPDEARALVAAQTAAEAGADRSTFEGRALATVGRPLYEAFFRGYTAKQWQTDPRDLPGELFSRLPVRFTFDDRYFSDRFEGLPSTGYASVFARMSAHPNIDIRLEVDWFELGWTPRPGQFLVYSGPIDRFFDHRAGRLGWRTLDFEREVVATGDFQGTAIVNYPDETVPFTRIHEFRHLHPERKYPLDRTVIFREHSRAAGPADEPYYPINTAQDRARYDAYKAMSAALPAVLFGGRLGSYRYLDMHQAIGSALRAHRNVVTPFFAGGGLPPTGQEA